ncbi:MAG: hypothetical protein R3275_02075 [Saprospiraceae bacterium]|nr:hypothetical protein [Saprospiraceae bacterium]
MKRFILYNIVFFTTLSFLEPLSSQSYTPFEMDSVKWGMTEVIPRLGPGDSFEYWEIYTKHDTTINDTVYRIVAIRNLCNSHPDHNGKSIYSSPEYPGEYLLGGLREKDKYVYFRHFEKYREYRSYQNVFSSLKEDSEYLLYDFNAGTGDTIFHGELESFTVSNGDTSFHRFYPMTIILKDEIQNGKRILTASNNTTFNRQDRIIIKEGSGCNSGLIAPLRVYLTWSKCYLQPYNPGETCIKCPGLKTSHYNTNANKTISVLPNPSNGILKIKSDVDYQMIKVIDIRGIVVDVLESDVNEKMATYIVDLPPGFYSLIFYQNGEILTYKAVILGE